MYVLTLCIVVLPYSVPKPDSLLEDVVAGRVDQVLSAISQMQNSVLSKSGHKGKERLGTPGTPSTSAAKRRKACSVGEDTRFGVRDRVCVCVCACVRACVDECVCVCVCVL